jgi:hypothetical protein
MKIVNLTTYDFTNDRAEIRKELINLFLSEDPGTGKGDFTSKYIYITKIVGAHDIYLSRPAQFNNGFDFTLNVSNINFNPEGRATTRPTHQNIFDDLELKKETNPDLYDELKVQIDKIYNCSPPTKTNFDFGAGLNSEILLECIKWLFIEQDVTYWNYSGRAMFHGGICEI